MQTQIKAKGIGHMVHQYDSYDVTSISRSIFHDPHSLITSMNAGYLVPIYWRQMYPSDTLKLKISTLSRLATQIVPFMDNVYMDIHVWCVPNRLVWEHWVNMHGEQKNPGDSIDYLVPQITSSSLVDGANELTPQSIFDYFGVPVNVPNLSFNSLIFRAYQLTWNEWYRDENLQNSIDVETGDSDDISNYTLLKRGKRKDYFTSCLPFAQKGDGVDIPLSTDIINAPVVYSGASSLSSDSIHLAKLYDYLGRPLAGSWAQNEVRPVILSNNSSYPSSLGGGTLSSGGTASQQSVGFFENGTAQVDLSSVTGATINSLRQAFAIQRLLEKDARGGTRYIEMNLAHFGAKSADARLQRPEFLGGGTFDLNLNIIPQTSATDSSSPQGNLSSFGVINGMTKEIVTSFTEHCLVFAVASIRASLTYQQGLDREFSRQSRYDYYYPELCNLGEQAVLNKEIYAQGSSVLDSTSGDVVDDMTFGYQERWSELRRSQNKITGMLRSSANLSLDIWHLAQDFSSLPQLNSEFIEENPPIDRVIAVDSSDTTPQFICNFFFDEYLIRPMSVNSIPSLRAHY